MSGFIAMESLQLCLLDYLKKTDYSSSKLETILQDAAKIRTSLEQKLPTKALKEGAKGAFLLVQALAGTCFELIFSPAKGYIFVTNTIAALSNTIQAILGVKSKMPRALQPRVDEINEYRGKIETKMKRIEDGIIKLLEKIDRACENDFVVSREEMGQLTSKRHSLECELKTCGHDLQETQKLLDNLQSTVRKRLFELGVFAVAAAATGGALLAGYAAVGGSAALGAVWIFYVLLTALTSHSQLLPECERIKSELRKTNLQFRVNKRTVEDSLAEEMALLDIRE